MLDKPLLDVDEKKGSVILSSYLLNDIAQYLINKYSIVYFNGTIWVKNKKIWKPSDIKLLKSWFKNDFKDLKPKQIEEVLANVKMLISYEDGVSLKDIKYKVFFTNGYFDIKNSKFVSIANKNMPFSPNIIPYDFKNWLEKKDTEEYKKAKTKIDTLVNIFSQQEEDHKKFWYEMVGGAFVPFVPFAKFFINHGDGDNGKSWEIKLKKSLLGEENCSSFSIKRLTTAQKSDGEMMNFYGKLWNHDPDAKKITVNDIGEIKQLTGGDEVTGRNLYSDQVKFNNYSAVEIYSNHIPSINEINKAVNRRMVIRGMYLEPLTLPEDKRLSMDEFEWVLESTEVKQIIAHQSLMAFSQAFKRGHYTSVKSIEKLTKAFKEESNDIYRWTIDDGIKDKIIQEEEFTFNEMFALFKTWYLANHSEETKKTQKGFTMIFKSTLKSEYGIELEQKQIRLDNKNVRVNKVLNLSNHRKHVVN